MANSYTTRLKKRLPAVGDVNWDDEWHDNEKIDEVVTGALLSVNRVISGGAVTAGTLLVADYAALDVWLLGARASIIAGSLAMTAAQVGQQLTNWVYVDATGAVVVSTTPPSGDYIPLAQVDTSDTTIVRIADLRPLMATAPTAAIGTADTAIATTGYVVAVAANNAPFEYQRGATRPAIKGYLVASDRYTLTVPRLRVADYGLSLDKVVTATELSLADPANWDSASPDYTVATNRAGKDFRLYLLTTGALILSANTTAPVGHTTSDSLKIGGFHCLCTAVGTITGHTITGFAAGDILPASVWDLLHRPVCSPAGMVYSAAADLWVDIYLQSGTGINTASAYGATIIDTRDWMDFCDDLAAVSKRLLRDPEFQAIAAGSNEMTNISGSADPVTTGGHSDTAGRRMISNIGCEDCCGALWQWLADQSYATDSAALTFAWYTLPEAKGSIYKQGGTLGDVKLLAGGYWTIGTSCGSRARAANSYRWATSAIIGARGCARSRA